MLTVSELENLIDHALPLLPAWLNRHYATVAGYADSNDCPLHRFLTELAGDTEVMVSFGSVWATLADGEHDVYSAAALRFVALADRIDASLAPQAARVPVSGRRVWEAVSDLLEEYAVA